MPRRGGNWAYQKDHFGYTIERVWAPPGCSRPAIAGRAASNVDTTGTVQHCEVKSDFEGKPRGQELSIPTLAGGPLCSSWAVILQKLHRAAEADLSDSLIASYSALSTFVHYFD